ncbi:MAG: hypothetical protein M3457_21930, partial [Chloroflexota bacterium]|nr:hypothetical protein [Chloroflexota bacterium]
AELSYKNMEFGASGSVAVGKFVILTRDSGAAGWDVLFEKSDVVNGSTTIARATYTPTEPVKHLAFAVWPWDEIEVDERTKRDQIIQVRWSDYVEVTIDNSTLVITLEQAETEIYELAQTVSVDPNDGRTVANSVDLGAAVLFPKANISRAAVKLNEVVILNAETRTAEVWNSTLTTKVEDLPIYAVQATVTRTVLGVRTKFSASEWVPVRPSAAGVPITVTESPMGSLQLTAETKPAWIP